MRSLSSICEEDEAGALRGGAERREDPDPIPICITRSATATSLVSGKPAFYVDAMVINPPDLHIPPHVNGHSHEYSPLPDEIPRGAGAKRNEGWV